MTDTKTFRYLLVLPVLLIAGLGVSACTGGQDQGGSTTTSAPLPSPADNPVAAIDPCGLLTNSEVSRLGLTSRGPESSPTSRGCGWSKGASYSFGIYVDPTQGLDVLRGKTSTSVSLASHDAIQTASGIDCLVDIAITKTSSVGISAEGDVSTVCQVAVQYAALIEPKLPAQQK